MTNPNPEPQAGDHPDEATVLERLGCPRCGEVRLDCLLWLPPYFDAVECQTCSCVYEP